MSTTKRSKFNNRRGEIDGISFDSEAEARHYLVLRDRQQRGEISGLTVHPRYPLTVRGTKVCTYVGDFLYHDNATRRPVVEDVKGVKTPVYRLKKKLMLAILGIEVVEVQA